MGTGDVSVGGAYQPNASYTRTGGVDTGGTYVNAVMTTPTIQAAQISGQGATATLTAAQSGSTVLFDRAAGIVYTLPPPKVGLTFTFVVTTTITSNNAEVDTDAGTTFMMGGVHISSAGTTGDFTANGTSNVKIQLNGTTKGGILGSQFTMSCVSATQWQVTGLLNGSGVAATPFA